MQATTENIIGFLREHKDTFSNEFSVTKIGLFGSYARNEGRDDSDIDIVVELAKPDLFHLIGIQQTIEDAFGKKVDVIRFRERMNQALRRRIEKDVIYV